MKGGKFSQHKETFVITLYKCVTDNNFKNLQTALCKFTTSAVGEDLFCRDLLRGVVRQPLAVN
jgi:hypothetical protein